jgi:hypothetical protein
MLYVFAPDLQLNHCLIDAYIVPAGQTVRVGAPVKLSALANPNTATHKGRVIQEAIAATDIALGVALGEISNPRETFVAGEIVRVAHISPWLVPGFAKGNISAGDRVIAASGGGFTTAPAWNNAGATLVYSPGIALDTATDGQAFTFMPLPTQYVAA